MERYECKKYEWVKVDKSKCDGCGDCVAYCPRDVLRLDNHGYPYMAYRDDCWYCDVCTFCASWMQSGWTVCLTLSSSLREECRVGAIHGWGRPAIPLVAGGWNHARDGSHRIPFRPLRRL
jgi:NAD-dependent dihydropyrimidine dehydrogenase PreA subunit